MIKSKPSVVKPMKCPSLTKRGKHFDQENIKPYGFNTKGYFDPTRGQDSEYINLKQKILDKYRNKDQEIVMLDIKNINRGLLINKGMMPSQKKPQFQENILTEKKSNQILKSYLMRKEKYCNKQEQRYTDIPKLTVEQLTSRGYTARSINSRHLSSRISTNSFLKAQQDI